MGKFKYANKNYLFPVMTSQETDLMINELLTVKQTDGNSFEVAYSDKPQSDFVGLWDGHVMSDADKKKLKKLDSWV